MNIFEEAFWNTILDSFKNNDNEDDCANKLMKFSMYFDTVNELFNKKRKHWNNQQRKIKKIEKGVKK